MVARALAMTASMCLVSIVSLVAGCRVTATAEKPNAPAPASQGELQRAVDEAKQKLALAELQLDITRKKSEDARMRKERELELARDELAQFEAVDAPSRLAKVQLELARRKDALFEQREELKQLEMLYEKEDLADKTREIVLQRGKRRVERAQDELAIQERDTKALEERTLPRERSKIALEVESKARELDTMLRENEAAMLEKRLGVEQAQAAVHAAEVKLGSAS